MDSLFQESHEDPVFFVCRAQIVELLACKCGLCQEEAQISLLHLPGTELKQREDERHGQPEWEAADGDSVRTPAG